MPATLTNVEELGTTCAEVFQFRTSIKVIWDLIERVGCPINDAAGKLLRRTLSSSQINNSCPSSLSILEVKRRSSHRIRQN